MSDNIRYHKRSEKWYDRYPETIWMVADVFTTVASAVLGFYWFSSDKDWRIIAGVIMSINTLLGFIRVIQHSMRLEDRV